MIRKITLCEEFSYVLIIVSMICLFLNSRIELLFVFVVGGLSVYPGIYHMWLDVETFWDKRYKKFFQGTLSEKKEREVIGKHWDAIGWCVPYIVLMVGYVVLTSIYLFGMSAIVSVLGGGLLSTGLVSLGFQRRLDL